MKDRINKKLAGTGWNWMSTTEKYIRVGSDIQELRYWIAPFVSPNDNAVEEKRAKGFRSLKELEKFLDERVQLSD